MTPSLDFALDLPMLSPSQVKLAQCEMAWWFKYHEKKPDIPKKATQDGFAIDRIVMESIQTGRLPASGGWGTVACAALHGLEWDKRPLQAQVMISGCNFGGAFFGGWDENRPVAIDALDESGEIPFVQDLKTTGDKRWVQSEEKLRKDIQALLYARAAQLRYFARTGKLPERVNMRWVYVTRNPTNPKLYPVAWTFTAEDIDAGEKLWEPHISRTLEIACRSKEGTLVEDDCAKNTDKCGDYGGCAYGPKFHGCCNLSLIEMYQIHSKKKTDETMTQLDPNQIAGLLSTTGMPLQQNGQQGAQQPQQMGQGQPLIQHGTASMSELQNPQQQLHAQQQHHQQMQYAQGVGQQFVPQQPQNAPQFAPTTFGQQQQPPQQFQQQPSYNPAQVQAFLGAQGQIPNNGQQLPAQLPANIDPPAPKKRGRPSKADQAARAAQQNTPGAQLSVVQGGYAPTGGGEDGDDESEDLREALETVIDIIVTKLAAKLRGN